MYPAFLQSPVHEYIYILPPSPPPPTDYYVTELFSVTLQMNDKYFAQYI